MRMLILSALLLGLWMVSGAAEVNVAVFVFSNSPSTVLPSTIVDDPLRPSVASYDLVLKGAALVKEQVDAQGGIPVVFGNSSITLKLTYFNVGPTAMNTNITEIVKSLKALVPRVAGREFGYFPVWIPILRDAAASLVLSAACEYSEDCIVILPVTTADESFKCPEPLTADCRAKGRNVGHRRFDFTFGVLCDSSYVMSSFVQFAKYKQAKTTAVVSSTSTYGSETRVGIHATLEGLNMPVLLDVNLPVTQDGADKVVAQLAALNPDVLVLFAQPAEAPACFLLIETMKKMNWFPKAFGNGGPCISQAYPEGGNHVYAYYDSPWNALVRGPEYRTIASNTSFEPFPATEADDAPQIYSKAMIERFDVSAENQQLSILGTAAIAMVVKAVESAGLSAPLGIDLRNSMNRLQAPSVFGMLQMDPVGRLGYGVRVVAQYTDTKLGSQLVSPMSIGAEPIWPAPNWDERELDIGVFSDDLAEKLVVSLNVICLVIVAGITLLVWQNRKMAVIKASTPLFCFLTLGGALVMLITPFMWNLHLTNETCTARIWFLQMGFTIMFGSIPIKSFRVHRIFSLKKLTTVRITTEQLLFIFLCIFGGDVLYTIVWTVYSPTEATLVTADPFRPALSYYACSTDQAHNAFAIVAVVLKACMVLVGVVLAWLTRKIPTEFNESMYIGLATYNLFFLSAVGVPIVATEVGGRVFAYCVRSIGIILIATITVALLFGSKLLMIIHGRGGSGGGFGERQAHTVISGLSGNTGNGNTNLPISEHRSGDPGNRYSAGAANANARRAGSPTGNGTAPASTGRSSFPGRQDQSQILADLTVVNANLKARNDDQVREIARLQEQLAKLQQVHLPLPSEADVSDIIQPMDA